MLYSSFHLNLLLILLIWTPLAFGSVHALSYSLLVLHAFFLVGLWIVPLMLGRHRRHGVPAFVWTPMAIPVIVFLVLIALQLVPMPLEVLKLLSPSTEELYRLYLPDEANIWMPLSLNRYTTRLALVKLLAYAGVFFLVVNTVRTREQIRKISWVIVAVAAGMGLLGIVQKWLGINIIYLFRDASLIGNEFGPYVNGNHFAGYEAMAILLGLGLFLSSQPEDQFAIANSVTRPAWPGGRFLSLERLLLIICLLLMVSALFLSRSRGGFLAFVCGFVGFALLLPFRQVETRRRSGLMVVFLGIGVLLFLLGGPLFIRFLNLLAGDEALPWAGRLAVFQATWKMAQDFPLFGIGYEAYASIFPRYQLPEAVLQTYSHAHNDVLQLLAETGRIGLVVAVVGIVLGTISILRHWRRRHDPFVQGMVPAGVAACLAIGAHSFVDFNLHIPANALLATTILALMFACVNIPTRGTRSRRQDPEPPGLFGRIGQVFACWVVFGVMVWGGVVAVRVGVADGFYPQFRLPYTSHWTYVADADVRLSRLQQALPWTPNNPWYLASIAGLQDTKTVEMKKARKLTDDNRQSVLAAIRQVTGWYEQALRQSPTDSELQLGWLRHQQISRSFNSESPRYRTEEVLHQYEQVASLAPAYPQIQYTLGYYLLYTQGETSGEHHAAPFFRQAIRLDKRYDRLTWDAYRQRLPEGEALSHFARTMPNTAQGHFRTAQVLQDSHWSQARLHYYAALAQGQTDAEMLRAYADAALRYQDFKTARRLWSRLVDLEPEDTQAYLKLARAARGLKDVAGEVQALESVVKRFPRHAKYADQLAQAYLRSGKTVEAMTMWEQVIALKPDSHAGYTNLAHLYEQRGDRAKAFQAYLKLAQLRPRDASVMYRLGEYYRQDGDLSNAIRYYRRAVKLRPKNKRFQEALEKALEQRG